MKNPGFVVLLYGSLLSATWLGLQAGHGYQVAGGTVSDAARRQLGGSWFGLPATLGYVFTARLRADLVSCGIRVGRLPVKIAPTLVMVNDGGIFCIIVVVRLTLLGLLWGNPRFGSLGLEDDDAFGVVLPHQGIVSEQVLAGGAKKWSGVISTASTAAGLDSVAQRDLSDGRAQDGCVSRRVAQRDLV